VVQTFVQLNVSSQGSVMQRQRNTNSGRLVKAYRTSLRWLPLLAERLKVFDLEANMVQPASFGRHGRRVDFGNEQASGYVGGCELTSLGSVAPNIFAYQDCISTMEGSVTQKWMWSMKSVP